MAEPKKRSNLFRFFYIVLSIVTFPIFVLLFIFRHPLWILFVLCLVAGVVVYYPMSQGVKSEEILTWYQNKYEAFKMEAVTKAVESGDAGFIPESIVQEVKETKRRMEEEAAEAARPKGENYNAKLSRDKKVEQDKVDFKKRKGGFKKTMDNVESARDVVEQEDAVASVAEDNNADMTVGVEDIQPNSVAVPVADVATVPVADKEMQETAIDTVVQEDVVAGVAEDNNADMTVGVEDIRSNSVAVPVADVATVLDTVKRSDEVMPGSDDIDEVLIQENVSAGGLADLLKVR